MLTFASPLWALGAVAAVGVPLLAHLLSRSKYREVLFPVTRLVQQAVVQTTRIERPRHWLLLLLRLLALLAVVTAFMQPRWTPKAEAIDPERGIALVVLLDASASMRRVESGATLYQRAAREAEALIQSLDPARDVASVIRVQRSAQPVLPEPTARLNALTGRLASTEASYESANWGAAFSLAGRLFENDRREKRVVVISDQQGDTLSSLFADGAQPGALPFDARVDHVRMTGPTDNTALRLIDLRPYPPSPGLPFEAIIELRHYADQPRQITLAATLGPQETRRQITLPPRAKQQVTLPFAPVGQGVHLLEVRLEGVDAIVYDDMAGAVLRVDTAPRVLLAYEGQVQRRIAERVGLVLRPGDEGLHNAPHVELTAINQLESALLANDADEIRTVVLLATKGLDANTQAVLELFNRRGGGVVQFVDGKGGGTPAAVDGVAANLDFSLEPLRVFEGPSRGAVSRLVWPGVRGLSLSEGEQSIVTDERGQVIIAATNDSRGRWVRINTRLAPEPGGLFAEPAFVVLFNELCRFASPGAEMPRPLLPGDRLPEAWREASLWLGERDRSALESDANNESNVDAVGRITQPGAYLVADADSGLVGGIFAELDPAESDTTLGTQWQDVGGADGSVQADAAVAGGLRREPIELWPYLLLGVLVLAGVESSLLWRFARHDRGDA